MEIPKLKIRTKEKKAPSEYSLAILGGMQPGVTGKQMYYGTVPYAEKVRRRKANKVARASRKRNRR